MDRSSRQKINKATEILNDTIEQLDSIDIFSTSQWRKMDTHPRSHGDDEELNSISTENISGLRNCW